jgi:polysaccharide deacetylase 2 family uncharacterized protein YibQ
VGYNKHDIDAIMIKGQLTFSILPHTPFAKTYADLARSANKDVMLHIPMQSISGKGLGPGALTVDMDQQQIEIELSNALEEIPFAIGINNHMGSLLTQNSLAMSWTMAFLRREGLFFVDSRTTRFTVGETIAKRAGVFGFRRNVFIDNNLSESAMKIQLDRLVSLALKNNQAIGIAHPHPETVKFLNKYIPRLNQLGVSLVPISHLLPNYDVRLARSVANPVGTTE